MAIFGTVTINSGTINFSDCDVVMGKDAKIIVKPDATLRILNNSHLYACDRIWDGIVAENGSTVMIYRNAIIEDAEVAVDLKYGTSYYLNSATFNRNYVHVQKTMPTGTPDETGNYPIRKCKFLCQTTASLGGAAVHTDLLPPRSGERSNVGVLAMGVPKILVGTTSAADRNTLDNIDWGAFAWTVGRVDVLHNSFTDIGNGGAYAVFGPGNGGETIDISHNDFKRIPFPIHVYDNDSTVRTRITYNEIDFAGMTDPPIDMRGITVSEITPGNGVDVGNFNYADISYNTILNAPMGIHVQNLRGDLLGGGLAKLYIGNDTITHTKDYDFIVGAGIRADNVMQAAIVSNDISNPYGHDNWWEHAIWVGGGHELAIECNETYDIGQSIFVDGDIRPYTTIARNIMENNARGIFLNWGYVGQQGHGTRPSDNQWLGSWSAGKPNTSVWGTGVEGNQSPFFVRNSSPYNPQHNITQSGAASPIAINIATGSWGDCEADQAAFKTGDSESDGLSELFAIISAEEPETERGRSVRWMGEYNLYQKLRSDEGLQSADGMLSTFYADRHTGNMGRLHRAIDGFRAARNSETQPTLEGLAALQAVQPQNRVEQTLSDLLEILYANATDIRGMGVGHTERLRSIARLCPLDDGLGVYMARAALLSIDTLPRGYMNECEQVPAPEDGYGKQDAFSGEANGFAVYPNPNSGMMTVRYHLEEGERGMLRVHSTTGILVYQGQLNTSADVMQIEIIGMSPGLYLMTIEVNNERRLTERVSIVR